MTNANCCCSFQNLERNELTIIYFFPFPFHSIRSPSIPFVTNAMDGGTKLSIFFLFLSFFLSFFALSAFTN